MDPCLFTSVNVMSLKTLSNGRKETEKSAVGAEMINQSEVASTFPSIGPQH